MKKNHRIRRRRASTGEAFGSRSRHSSPTSIRDFTTIPASSFDDAFKKGTILPYFLDTAVKSFDSAMRSYSSCDVAYATTGLKNEGYLFQSKLEEQPYEEQKQQFYQHSGQTKHQQPSGTTGTTRIKRRPHQQRRCKSLNDLRIHHDRELDEIEIERPRSTDDSTDSDDYYTEGEFDDDDENDCNYSTATTTITTTHVSSSSLEENVSCVFVSAEAAASYSLPVSTSAQCLLYRSSQQQEKQQQDDETNNTLEYVSESIQKTQQQQQQQQQEDDNSEQDSSLSPATTTTLTSTMSSSDSKASDASTSSDTSSGSRRGGNDSASSNADAARSRAMSGGSVSSTGSGANPPRGSSGSLKEKSSLKTSRSSSGSSKGGDGSSGGGGGPQDMLERVHVQHPGADRTALKELPALRDAPPAKREELFVLKLKLCSVIFNFDDPMADKRGKDMKRQTLLELVDYVNTPAGQKIFTESIMGDLMMMVSSNVCRALPPATDDFDPEEDEPVLEPAWPHLQVAYEFFLRYIVSSEVNAKAAKKYVDQKFCLQLVELFDSEDPRERDYLKTILHRIYGKFMSHRSFIRRAISNVFYRFVYETERHNGIGELLEILGSIINGFAIPLKKEHLQFLVRALIPLHKPKCVALYHQQLSYCIIQYVEKDADTATPILNGFFKCWPWSSSGKQVMFLNELEEILELLGADQLAQVSDMLFTNLARCLDSDHFQVVERALFLWNNEHLVNSGCLSRLNAQAVLPIIYGPLYKNSSGHWNATVEGLAQNVLKMYMEYDLVLYDRCTANYFRDEEEAKRKLKTIEDRWAEIEHTASTNQPAISVK